MFLRFLIADGRCRVGLLGAIPVVAHWRLAAMPACLSSDDVERLITKQLGQSSGLGVYRRSRAVSKQLGKRLSDGT